MFQENLNAEGYAQILYDHLIPYVASKFTNNSDVIIHQDNDPKHSSIICKKVLKDNKLYWVT